MGISSTANSGLSLEQTLQRAKPSMQPPAHAATPWAAHVHRNTCLSNSLHTTTSEFSSSFGFAGNESDFFLTSGNDFK